MTQSFPKFEKELLKSIHVPRDHPQYKVYLDYGLNRFTHGKKIISCLKEYIGKDEMKVLDIGCGVGGISAAFADESIRIVSTEFDVNYKHLIRKMFEDIGKTPKILIADGHELPFKMGSFNVVLAVDLLEHIRDLKKFISEIARLTTDGNILCMTLATRFDWNNIKRDPHYGLFGVILLPRFLRKLIVVDLLKRNPTLDDFTWIRSFKRACDLFRKHGILLKRVGDLVLGLKVSSPVVDVGDGKDIFQLDTGGENPDHGWHKIEVHPEGNQRWTKKVARGYILVPKEASKFNISVSCCNPEIADSPPQCRVKLGGRRIGAFVLRTNDWHEYNFNIPHGLCDGELKPFELRVDITWVPSEVTGSSDSRKLGVAERWIKCT